MESSISISPHCDNESRLVFHAGFPTILSVFRNSRVSGHGSFSLLVISLPDRVCFPLPKIITHFTFTFVFIDRCRPSPWVSINYGRFPADDKCLPTLTALKKGFVGAIDFLIIFPKGLLYDLGCERMRSINLKFSISSSERSSRKRVTIKLKLRMLSLWKWEMIAYFYGQFTELSTHSISAIYFLLLLVSLRKKFFFHASNAQQNIAWDSLPAFLWLLWRNYRFFPLLLCCGDFSVNKNLSTNKCHCEVQVYSRVERDTTWVHMG